MSTIYKFRGSLTPAIPIGENAGIIIPSDWVTADISFLVSNDGSYFHSLYDEAGAEVVVKTVKLTAVSFGTKNAKLYPFGYMKIRSGSLASPVVQGVTSASKVYTIDTGKTLTIDVVTKGSIGNEISFGFDTAEDDVLAINVVDKVVTILFAKDTASNNTAAAIQVLLRAATIADIDVTDLTVAEDAGYIAARPTVLEEAIPPEPLAGGTDVSVELVFRN